MEIGYGDMTSTPTLSHFPATDDRGPELGSADPPEDWLPGALLRWVVAPLVALWCAFLVLTWLPSYLTWPWQNDSEHFAMLAQLWDSGKLPYRDMFSTQFPGEIYIHYLLGKVVRLGQHGCLLCLRRRPGDRVRYPARGLGTSAERGTPAGPDRIQHLPAVLCLAEHLGRG